MNMVFLFIMGAVCGSFMNVCIYRMPRKESLITPRSHCPSCKSAIKWFDNIPILSFLLLKGKCRSCGERIETRYPIVEALSALIWVLLFLRFGLSAKFFIMLYFLSSLIVISFIDLRICEIPDSISLSGIALGMCLAAIYPPLTGRAGNFSSFLNSFLGVIAGGGSIYLLGFLGEFIFKREAMGGGDVKLMAMIGAFLGWKLVLFTFFLAPFFGSIIGIILKLREGKDVIPYGPYLSLAALVAIFWGEDILKALLLGG